MAHVGNNRRLMSDINVTPFVDVMLVLLIIFMVTVPMMMQGVEVNLPKTTTKNIKTQEEPLILTINKKKGNLFRKTPGQAGWVGAKACKDFPESKGKGDPPKGRQGRPLWICNQGHGEGKRVRHRQARYGY